MLTKKMAEVFPLDINDSVAEENLSSDDDIIEVITWFSFPFTTA